MERKVQAGRERKILERIVALLLSFADLAEQVSGRSRAVCWLVLCFLRPAEAIANDYVAALTPNLHPAGQVASGPAGDCAAEAMRLAQAFRMLAAVLAALLDAGLAPWQAATALADFASLARFANGARAALDGSAFASIGHDTS